MRIRDLLRAVAVTLLLLAIAAAPADAAVPAALGPEGRVFTFTGDGTERPREGLPLHRVRGALSSVAPLPDGDVVVLMRPFARPWLAGTDGRLHTLPLLRRTTMVASAPDGTVLAYSGDLLSVMRLRADRTGWDRVLDVDAALDVRGDESIAGLTVFPGGSFAFMREQLEVWRATPDGTLRQVALPEQTEATALAALPGGELAVAVQDSGAESRVMIAPEGGALRPFTASEEVFYLGLAAAPGGGMLGATGALDLLDASGRRVLRLGRSRALGPGDGGPPARARLPAVGVGVAGDGTVLVPEFGSRGFLHIRTGSAADDVFLDLFSARGPFRLPTRALVPPGTTRPLAAVARDTFRELADGRVELESTFAGRATVVVTRRGEEVARAAADVPAGSSAIALPSSPPAGDLTVTAEVLAAGGRVAGGTLEVSTHRRLTGRDARRAIRHTENLIAFTSDDAAHVAGCRRDDGMRVACEIRGRGGRCKGGVVITQHPDGRHVRFTGKRRAC